MSLLAENYLPLEDKDGKFVEIMGSTSTQVVLIYAGGKTRSLEKTELPDVEHTAGTKLYLNEDGTLQTVSTSLPKKASASSSNRQTPRYMPDDHYAVTR